MCLSHIVCPFLSHTCCVYIKLAVCHVRAFAVADPPASGTSVSSPLDEGGGATVYSEGGFTIIDAYFDETERGTQSRAAPPQSQALISGALPAVDNHPAPAALPGNSRDLDHGPSAPKASKFSLIRGVRIAAIPVTVFIVAAL
jgi:hypothetical protein